MKYELIIREEAELEIIEATKYYESQQIGKGIRFLAHLQTYFDRNINNFKISIPYMYSGLLLVSIIQIKVLF